MAPSPLWVELVCLTLQTFASYFFRVHRPWRATWRVSLAFWRQTFRTTKTKSFVFYVLCKFKPVLPFFLLKWSVFFMLVLTLLLFVDSARLLPEKLTVYTTLVGLLNARNYNFGGEFVEAMIRQLKETLKNNLYNEAVYLVTQCCKSTWHIALKSINIPILFWTF